MKHHLAIAVAASLALPVIPVRAADHCFTRDDLAWNATVLRAFPVIDRTNSDCITPSQIAAYLQALRVDRREQPNRIRAKLSGG